MGQPTSNHPPLSGRAGARFSTTTPPPIKALVSEKFFTLVHAFFGPAEVGK